VQSFHRCPHCNALAELEPNRQLGFSCLVCGGPRLPLNLPEGAPAVELSSSTQNSLKIAAKHHTRQLMFRLAGWFLLGLFGLTALIATLVVLLASPGVVLSVLSAVLAAAPGVTAFMAFAQAAGLRRLRAAALHEAELGGLADVQAALGPLDAARAAEIFGITGEHAELLLAEASVGAMLGALPEPRVRVAAELTPEPGASLPAAEQRGELHGRSRRSMN
jgi:LSD1 subclass zinc finger protein